jgi:hypothetical protein
VRGGHSQRDRGQALVELALVFPLLTVLTFAALQFVLIFLTYLSLMAVAWDAARYIAVHPHIDDPTFRTMLAARVPPNLSRTGVTWEVVNDTPPGLNLKCPSLVNGKCPNRDPYRTLHTQVGYSVAATASVILLPTQFGCCGLVVSMPNRLPYYDLYVMIEPS